MTLLVGGTALSIKFAKGYRPSLKQIALEGTGLLSTTSYPKSAQVFVNDKLTTVTDDTVYLEPDDYQVKILKNGFQPWTKTLPIRNELVSTADARLFPALPTITPLTFYQVSKALISPDNSKVLYLMTESPFASDNGVYILSLSPNFLGSQLTQIADMNTHDYSTAQFFWSPDSSQILAAFVTDNKISSSHLLSPRSFNDPKNMVDSTFKIPQMIEEWQSQAVEINLAALKALPIELAQIATQSAQNVYFSPDKEKFFFTASVDFSLPDSLVKTSLPNINPTAQTRNLKKGEVYVFDLKEYTNYKIEGVVNSRLHTLLTNVGELIPTMVITPTPTPSKIVSKTTKTTPVTELTTLEKLHIIQDQFVPQLSSNLNWYPSNRHLILSTESGLDILEYDGLNRTTIINEIIKDNLSFVSPDGNRLIVLSNLNQKADAYNLFAVDLK